MSKRQTWHVTPHEEEGWQVKKEEAQRASSLHETKTDAVSKAKQLAKKRTLGQVLVHKTDGTIQNEFTYGDDPPSSPG